MMAWSFVPRHLIVFGLGRVSMRSRFVVSRHGLGGLFLGDGHTMPWLPWSGL